MPTKQLRLPVAQFDALDLLSDKSRSATLDALLREDPAQAMVRGLATRLARTEPQADTGVHITSVKMLKETADTLRTLSAKAQMSEMDVLSLLIDGHHAP